MLKDTMPALKGIASVETEIKDESDLLKRIIKVKDLILSDKETPSKKQSDLPNDSDSGRKVIHRENARNSVLKK